MMYNIIQTKFTFHLTCQCSGDAHKYMYVDTQNVFRCASGNERL